MQKSIAATLDCVLAIFSLKVGWKGTEHFEKEKNTIPFNCYGHSHVDTSTIGDGSERIQHISATKNFQSHIIENTAQLQ